MIYPVTPNGVEHATKDVLQKYGATVIYPVTPNGVEHFSEQSDSPPADRDLSGNA